jgi:hypothetical protein
MHWSVAGPALLLCMLPSEAEDADKVPAHCVSSCNKMAIDRWEVMSDTCCTATLLGGNVVSTGNCQRTFASGVAAVCNERCNRGTITDIALNMREKQVCNGFKVCSGWYKAGTKQVQAELDAFKKFLANHPDRRRLSQSFSLSQLSQDHEAKQMSAEVAVRN